MTTAEKRLYHQIHPLKLASDISAAIISLIFFWQHQLGVAVAVHLIPPVVASVLVMRYADLEGYRRSALGVYLGRYMTRPIEGLRLFGDVIMVLGAWYHAVAGMAVGLALIVGAWMNGLIVPRREFRG